MGCVDLSNLEAFLMITEERENLQDCSSDESVPLQGGMCPLPCPKHGIQSFIHKLPSFESAHSLLVFFHPAHSRCLMNICRVKEWVNLGMKCHSPLIMFVTGMHVPAPKPRLEEVKPASMILTQKRINNNNNRANISSSW